MNYFGYSWVENLKLVLELECAILSIHEGLNVGKVVFEKYEVMGVDEVGGIVSVILVDVVGKDEKFIEWSDIDIRWRFAFGNEIYCRSWSGVTSWSDPIRGNSIC